MPYLLKSRLGDQQELYFCGYFVLYEFCHANVVSILDMVSSTAIIFILVDLTFNLTRTRDIHRQNVSDSV